MFNAELILRITDKFSLSPFLILFLIYIIPAFGSGQNTQLNIWNGFQHEWTYNHRLNRMGDMLVGTGSEAIHLHTAATGLGPDSGKYSSWVTSIGNLNNIKQQSDTFTIRLIGKEKGMIQIHQNVRIPAKDFGKNAIAVINGFDIYSKSKADKLMELSIGISDSLSYKNNEVLVPVSVFARFGCSSPECPPFSSQVEYQLKVSMLILESQEIQILNKQEVHALQFWNTKIEPEDFIRPLTNPEDNNVLSVPVWTRIGIVLDDEHWYAGLTLALLNNETDETNYNFKFNFKEWRANMKKGSAFPKYSRFSFPKSGNATFSGTIQWLGFSPSSKIKQHQLKGITYWPGRNTLANDSSAVYQLPLTKSSGIKQ